MSSEGFDDIGKSAVLSEDLEDTYLNSFCKGFRVNPKVVNPYFLNYLLLSHQYRQLLILEGKGFTRINLKMSKINDFTVYIPPTIDEQNKIVGFLDLNMKRIEGLLDNIEKQNKRIELLKDVLINNSFSGNLI